MFYNQIYDKYSHLPTSMFYENNETFINTEGLIKRTTKLVSKGRVKKHSKFVHDNLR
jgi:NADH dehydrogenase/NADH:ubiquinone oxidoreductase subunit G